MIIHLSEDLPFNHSEKQSESPDLLYKYSQISVQVANVDDSVIIHKICHHSTTYVSIHKNLLQSQSWFRDNLQNLFNL